MSHVTLEEQEKLLRLLTHVGARGQPELETSESFKRTFLPIPEHARAFDPDVVLVIGERGAGKSELFRAVLRERLLPAIARHATNVRLPSSNAHWVEGYPLGAEFPDGTSIRRFAQEHADDRDSMLNLWLAYLVRTLRPHLDEQAQERLEAFFALQGGAAKDNHDAFLAAGDEPVLALDRLEQRLQRENGWIFIGYDELDTLGHSNWQAMGYATRGLISLWASYARRWRRIRAKVFLRTDLFHRHTGLAGADLAKLAANRIELTWSDRNLYAMLVKRIANFDDDLWDYCKKAKLSFNVDPDLGRIPILTRAEDAKPLIHRLMGEFMGPNPGKGKTFRWILDHTRDGRGKTQPRPFARLIERASEIEIDRRKANPPKLIHHTSIRRALDDVSHDQVVRMIANECPWLEQVKARIAGTKVPCERREIERLFKKDWDALWGATPAPADDPAGLFDIMIDLGILRDRSGGDLSRPNALVDAPDLFLAGLGLKRQGGVAMK